MKQETINRVLQGVVLTVLGILVAIYGAGTVVDTYFAVAGIIAGTILTALSFALIAKKQPVSFGILLLGVTLIAFAIGLFTHYVSIAVLIEFMVLVVLSLGVSCVLYGIYAIAKKAVPLGSVFIGFGAVCITLSALYIAIPDFRKAFWIAAGILMAVFGVCVVVFALVDTKKKK